MANKNGPLNAKQRNALHSTSFVFPKDRKYPIDSINRAKNALARSSGKPEEDEVKKAVYAKYPQLRPDTKSSKLSDMKSIHFLINRKVELSEDGEKWYPILEVGTMYSLKYSGIWDADPKIYMNEQQPGKIEIHLNYLQAILANFKAGKNETIPFVDIDHDEGISLGDIVDMKLEGNTLSVRLNWNEKGAKVVQDREYRYVSPGISPHINSQSGSIDWPVMETLSLTNTPVIKRQGVIELSEKAVSKDNKTATKNKTKGGSSMDELLAQIAQLATDIQSALENDETGAIKAAIGAAIDHLETTCGLEDEEDEVKAEDLSEKAKPPIAPTAPGTEQPPMPQKTQMSETEKSLTDQVAKQTLELAEMKKKIELSDFDKKYLHKKINPGELEDWHALYLSNKTIAIKRLDAMPTIVMLGELGTSLDIGTEVVKSMGEAKKLFDDKVVQLSEKNKIDTLSAIDLIKKESPDLYKMAYPGMK